MTTPLAHTLLSVRGQAQRVVAPDQADVQASISQASSSKQQASEEARTLLASLLADLATIGGVILTATSRRAPLTWSADNPQWGHVRADAIHAALIKGQDYASALGGAVIAVEHVADAGLLGGGDGARAQNWAASATMSRGSSGEATSLDPVPQVVEATIEARLRATAGPLPKR